MECVSEPRLCARPNTRARKSRRVRQETARGRCVQLPLLVARAARPGLPARVVEASWFQNRRCSKIAIEVRSDEQQEKSNRLINHHRDAALSRARAPLHRRELSSKARRYARFTTIAISSRGSIVVSGSRAAHGAPASPAWLRTLDCPSVTHPIPSSRAFQSASPSRSPRLLSPVSSARSRFVSRSPARRAEVDGVAGPGRRARRARVRGSAPSRERRKRANASRPATASGRRIVSSSRARQSSRRFFFLEPGLFAQSSSTPRSTR